MVHNFRKYITIIVFTAFSLHPASSQIVNIESLRFLSDTNGLFGQLTSEIEYKKDKIEHLKVGAGLHTAYKLNKHNILANSTIEYSKVGSEENDNNFFLHVRYNYAFTNLLIYELFFQTRYDDFLNIDERELIGTGMRIGLVDLEKTKLFAGITGMYEYELLTNEQVNKKFRMSDYLSFRYKNENFTFTTTVYHQPRINKFADFRTTWSSQLAFKLFKLVGMFINYDINYDSERPEGIPSTVTDITGGLSLTFSK